MFAILLSKNMDPFYHNIASFPTVFFTFFLALTVLYWLVAILGLIDIDFLDFDVPDHSGLDFNTDHTFSATDALAGLMMRLGLNGVPVTIIISFISLFGWIFSYFIVYFLFGMIPDGWLHYLAGIPVILVSLYIASYLTAWVIRSLRPLFKKSQQQTEKLILGQKAKVRSSRVDEGFGEAIVEDGGAGLILKVRAEPGKQFQKGDFVVVLEKIDDKGIYLVISEEDFH
jgi:membrane protein implicated in regulation of membrane protease activity